MHAIGTSSDLDDQAEKMAAKIKRKKKAEKERKERDEIAKLLPDPAEEESLLAGEPRRGASRPLLAPSHQS